MIICYIWWKFLVVQAVQYIFSCLLSCQTQLQVFSGDVNLLTWGLYILYVHHHWITDKYFCLLSLKLSSGYRTRLSMLWIFFEFILTDRTAVLMSNLLEYRVICCQFGVIQLKGQLWHCTASCLDLAQQSNYSCHTEWLASTGTIF